MGDVQTGIYLGAAIQVVYIALVTPGGTVSADVRAISYIGIPLSMVAVHSMGLNPASPEGQAMAVTLGSAVGTIGTVLFYGTATVNLVWQHMGWRALEKGDLRKLYVVDMGLPWISHILCSFIPTFIITKVGTSMVDLMKAYQPDSETPILHNRKVAVVGGVAANSVIRADLHAACGKAGVRLFLPPLKWCGDNGAMIGAQGYYEYQAGRTAGLDLNAYATMDLGAPLL